MDNDRFDHARRAAEAFMAANRCENPEEARRLRQEAYRLLDLIDEEREWGQIGSGNGNWAEVLSSHQGAAG